MKTVHILSPLSDFISPDCFTIFLNSSRAVLDGSSTIFGSRGELSVARGGHRRWHPRGRSKKALRSIVREALTLFLLQFHAVNSHLIKKVQDLCTVINN